MRRQRGSIVKKGRAHYIVFRDLEKRQKWMGPFPNKASARTRLNEILVEISCGTYTEPRPIRFSDFAESYLSGRQSIRGSTCSAYASMIRKHLVPFFGKLRLQEIRLKHVNQFVAETAPKVSVKTLRNCVTLLRVMLASSKGSSALRQGYIRLDPLMGVELPPSEARQIVPPTVESVWKLIDAAAAMGSVGYGMVYLAAFTGLRRGEILALTFDDVDWLQKELVISKSIARFPATDGVHKWVWRIGPTKSKKSNRRVGLTSNVLQLLSSLRQSAPNPNGLIFTDGKGSFIEPDYFDDHIFDPIRVNASLPDIRFHDLRHFFASMLIAQGESPKYVSDQLGHASIQITFDTYGHLFPQAKAEAASKFENRMLEGRKGPFVRRMLEKEGKAESEGRSTERVN
ncbi:MAG: tyrosine-type recombinase/integrase [Acidobacteriota bacterium]